MISVQWAEAARVMPIVQLVAATLNSLGDETGSPSTRKSDNTSGAFPVFVSVTLTPGDDEPTGVEGKFSPVLLRSTMGAALAGSTPSPDSAIVVTAGDAL